VIGRPAAFTREWVYTALSRARDHTTIHLITQRAEHDRERDEYAPAEPDPTPEETLNTLRRAMARSEREPLAVTHTPPLPRHTQTTPATRRVAEPDGLELLLRGRPQPTGRNLQR
jgi:hypothetical protein